MPAPNVVYLPGIFGSELGVPGIQGLPAIKAWISPASALSGVLLQLQLAADGVSPGTLTFGTNFQPLGIVYPAYGPLQEWMVARGWNVLTIPYDWRKSVLITAPGVLAAIQAALGSAPFVFVTHSLGGLVARAVFQLLTLAGQAGQCQGMVQLGCPNFGSWEPVRGFFGLPGLYQFVEGVAGLAAVLTSVYRVGFLDAIIASWPGWYELLPWRDAGPLFLKDPATAAALYQSATYAGGNPYIQPASFAAAVVTQHYLQSAIPLQRIVCVRGFGFATADEVNPGVPLSADTGYLYTADGDGAVPTDYATLLSAVNLQVNVSHGNLCRDPRVWGAVLYGVRYLVGPGA